MAWPTIIYGAAIATNAVFSNVVTQLCHEVKHWRLPIQCESLGQQASKLIYSEATGDCSLVLTSGWKLDFRSGILLSFSNPDFPAYRHRRNLDGKVVLSLPRALEIASNYVSLASLPDNVTWLNLTPYVERPQPHSEPYYTITWYRPNQEDESTVVAVVDGRDGKMVHLSLDCLYARLAPVRQRPIETKGQADPPTEQTRSELEKLISAGIGRWRSRLGLTDEFVSDKALFGTSTNWEQVRQDGVSQRWVTTIQRARWELTFVDGKLRGWVAPDAFFETEATPDLKQLAGKWRLSQPAAIKLVRRCIQNLSLGDEAVTVILQQPCVRKPKLNGPPTIPRYLLEWEESKPYERTGYRYVALRITAEVDADRGRITSLSAGLWQEGERRVLLR
jgi:hypothetical protein